MTWDPGKYRLPPLIGEPVPPRRVVASPSGPGAPRRPVAPRPPARRAQPPRRPVCGDDCHRQEKRQARLALGCCALVAAFVIVACVWPHHNPAPLTPGWGSGGSSRIYPHNPGIGAAVIAGEARGAARAAGDAARWGFRGARIARRGSFYVPGFHGYGFHLFGGF